MPVGLWLLLLSLVVLAGPELRVVGTTPAYAFGDEGGDPSYDQDSGVGGGGGAGASYGDPDGPQAGKKGSNPWRMGGGGSWRKAGVYGQSSVVNTRFWSMRDVLLGLRYFYLRF